VTVTLCFVSYYSLLNVVSSYSLAFLLDFFALTICLVHLQFRYLFHLKKMFEIISFLYFVILEIVFLLYVIISLLLNVKGLKGGG